MVGSYEESILRGWMSTAPSKPLDFTAQIGVLGKGSHKPKCPAHRIIPFPAVFYNWSTGKGRTTADEDPSPYVGHIDLQDLEVPTVNGEVLENDKDTFTERNTNIDRSGSSDLASKLEYRKSKRRRRTSPSSAPPIGGYRIPQQGQLQIIIKNPNKTAVKLFLVPYDLEGMEPGTKTFVRQRSYSADPVIDSPMAMNDHSELSASSSRKPTLRYLIHLNICSPSRGRFYLYQQIRVVFANRVPDNKEHLRNDIQLPQPRYSTYKPNREVLAGLDLSTGLKITTKPKIGAQNSVIAFGGEEHESPFRGGTNFSFRNSSIPPVPAIPFDLTVLRQESAESFNDGSLDGVELDSSRPRTSNGTLSPSSDRPDCISGKRSSSSHGTQSSQGSVGYNKLSKGDSGYGGLFRSSTPEPGEGLLAQRLKSLGVQRDANQTDDARPFPKHFDIS